MVMTCTSSARPALRTPPVRPDMTLVLHGGAASGAQPVPNVSRGRGVCGCRWAVAAAVSPTRCWERSPGTAWQLSRRAGRQPWGRGTGAGRADLRLPGRTRLPLHRPVPPRGAGLQPGVGRWMEQEPAGYVDGSNRYQGLDDAPASLLDPSGALPVAATPEPQTAFRKHLSRSRQFMKATCQFT